MNNCNRPVVITCALTGAQQGKKANANLPEQPQEIIEQGLAAVEAGASILHIHARDRHGKASAEIAIFDKIVTGLKKAGCKALLNLSTGGAVAGIPLQERLQILTELKPDIASFSIGSGCLLGKVDQKNKVLLKDQYVPLMSSYEEMFEMAKLFLANKTHPELEIYHSGMLNNLKNLIAMELIKPPYLTNLVMGIPGECSNASLEEFLFLKSQLPKTSNVHVTAIGGRNHFRLNTFCALNGGNVRIGMEDNIYISRGKKATSNAQIVAKMVSILENLGLKTANIEEAKKFVMPF